MSAVASTTVFTILWLLDCKMVNDRAKKQRAFATATRRFPSFELTVKRLVETDETFLDICDELADAEAALCAVDDIPVPMQSARRAEWQDLIDRLVAEISRALRSNSSERC